MVGRSMTLGGVDAKVVAYFVEDAFDQKEERLTRGEESTVISGKDPHYLSLITTDKDEVDNPYSPGSQKHQLVSEFLDELPAWLVAQRLDLFLQRISKAATGAIVVRNIREILAAIQLFGNGDCPAIDAAMEEILSGFPDSEWALDTVEVLDENLLAIHIDGSAILRVEDEFFCEPVGEFLSGCIDRHSQDDDYRITIEENIGIVTRALEERGSQTATVSETPLRC